MSAEATVRALGEIWRMAEEYAPRMPGGLERWNAMLNTLGEHARAEKAQRDTPESEHWRWHHIFSEASDHMKAFKESPSGDTFATLYDVVIRIYQRIRFDEAQMKNPAPAVETRADWEALPDRWFDEAAGD